MNLDRLRDAWQAQDTALTAHLKLNNRLLRELLLTEHRKEMRKKGWLASLELIVWIPSIIIMALFNLAHLGQWEFLMPGLLLQLWVTFIPLISIRQRAALRAVDISQPVLTLQREIEHLKMRRMWTLKWAFLVGQVVWYIPFLIVLFKGVFGVSLYAQPDWVQDFMLWNIVGGLLFIPLAVFLSRVLGPRLNARPRFRAFTDNLAGADMLAAREFLQRMQKFEQDGE